MNQKEISKQLKPFTDAQLAKELELRERKRKGKVLGYRAILSGDEYNYGEYYDAIISKQYPLRNTKKECEDYALQKVEESRNGGYVEELFRDTPLPSRIN